MRIRVKYQVITAVLIISVVASIAALVIHTQGSALRAQAMKRLEAVVEGAERISKEAFDASDRLMAVSYLMMLRRQYPELAFVSVRSGATDIRLGEEDGGLLFLERTARGRAEGEAAPGAANREVFLRFGFVREAIEAEVQSTLEPLIFRTAAIAGVFLALGLFLNFLVARLLTGPVEALAAATARVAEGKMDFSVPVRSRDELGTLTAAFNTMTAKLKELLETREDMLHTLTHEINTPLNGLKAYLELWEDGKLPGEAERKRVLDTMMTSVVRMETSLGNALALFRGEHVKPDIYAKPILVDEIVRQSLSMFARVAAEKNLKVFPLSAHAVCLIAPEEPVRQIVMNLISNAVKYTPEGGQIRVGLNDATDEVRLQVTNTGFGIPKEDIPHLFTKFFRSSADRARGARIPGTGLGLNIVKKAEIGRAHV